MEQLSIYLIESLNEELEYKGESKRQAVPTEHLELLFEQFSVHFDDAEICQMIVKVLEQRDEPLNGSVLFVSQLLKGEDYKIDQKYLDRVNKGKNDSWKQCLQTHLSNRVPEAVPTAIPSTEPASLPALENPEESSDEGTAPATLEESAEPSAVQSSETGSEGEASSHSKNQLNQ
jgi:hypothetical protein